MSRKSKFIIFILVALILAALYGLLLHGNDIPVLSPKGQIAAEQRSLIIFGSLLSLIVVIPVFTMTFFIAYKYRAGNKKAKYRPDWDSHKLIEAIWWGVPLVLIIILSVVTWQSTHKLDPFKPLDSAVKPVEIEVIALDWKWLFIYPEQDIATVNYVQFPVDTPINFKITADAPMNSFWIPSLGGQMYAMSGMSTKLHLMADSPGSYNGSSANISGEGFADMKFEAVASSDKDFQAWVEAVKLSSKSLSAEEYSQLSKPSKNNPKTYYARVEPGLYDKVMMKYMGPDHHNKSSGAAR